MARLVIVLGACALVGVLMLATGEVKAAPTNSTETEIKCGRNAVPTQCTSRCPMDCNLVNLNRGPLTCAVLCISEKIDGCTCLDGYVFLNNTNGDCVKKSECPRYIISTITKVITQKPVE